MNDQSILVCGGGIAGMACALGMARKGLGVQVLAPEVQRTKPEADTYHPRVYAISAANQRFLSELGIWDLMEQRRLSAVTAMELYGDGGGVLQLEAWQDARDTLTWIVESGEIERALRQALRVYGVIWHDDHFATLEANAVITESGQCLKADLVVGADGVKSKVREQAGIAHQVKAYGDSGIVAHLNAEFAHQGVAMQWFTGESVLALLPLPDSAEGPQVSMVWSTPAEQAHELVGLGPARQAEQLGRQLQAITGGRLGRLTVRSGLHAFPLTLEKSAMVAAGVALVSDAAHRVHPLAGQGLNLGLGDVAELIQVLADKPKQVSVGSLRILEQYRRARAEPIAAMAFATDTLHGLFKIQAVPVVWARNIGMSVLNKVPFFKRQLIANASGVSSRDRH